MTRKMTKARLVDGLARIGDVRCARSRPPNPADGMTAQVAMGDGAIHTIINPRSDPHPEWVMRYGNPLPVRYAVASLLESYDYLLSDEITMREATRRLRLLRAGRAALSEAGHE